MSKSKEYSSKRLSFTRKMVTASPLSSYGPSALTGKDGHVVKELLNKHGMRI